MSTYGPAFARLYNARRAGFSMSVVPAIKDFYESTPVGKELRSLLDVCCGTGQLARSFLDDGYRVIGIDLSEHMIRQARENAGPHLETGRATFVPADATSFALDEQVGLAVSVFDSLNHLEDLRALESCVRRVLSTVVDGGVFVFDLITRTTASGWNFVVVEEDDDALVVTRAIYDRDRQKTYNGVSGCIRGEEADAPWERFQEVIVESIHTVDDVRDALMDAGWARVWPAALTDLRAPLDEPEHEARVFFVACK